MMPEHCFDLCRGRYPSRNNRRHQCKACHYGYWKDRAAEAKEAIFNKLGHVCSRCGFADKRALQIDHVNGGGNREHLLYRNNRKFLRKVLDDISGAYQILCANCNWIKRSENNETAQKIRYPELGVST